MTIQMGKTLPYTTPEKEHAWEKRDARTPNQERFDRMIDFNRQQLEQLCQLNKNIAIIANVLSKLLEANAWVQKSNEDKLNQQVKKAVDKPVKVK